jgi:hypothetical protein
MAGPIHDIAVIDGTDGCSSAAGRGLPICLRAKFGLHANGKTRRRSTPS